MPALPVQTITGATGDAVALAGNSYNRELWIRITGANLWINFGAPAAANQGAFVTANDFIIVAPPSCIRDLYVLSAGTTQLFLTTHLQD